MSKSERIQRTKLEALESEFQSLLMICLTECAGGRWGLFGQNSIADPEDRYWTWPEAKRLREIASDIRSARSEFDETNPLCDRFLDLCRMKNSTAPGEPKLASSLLIEIEQGLK